MRRGPAPPPPPSPVPGGEEDVMDGAAHATPSSAKAAAQPVEELVALMVPALALPLPGGDRPAPGPTAHQPTPIPPILPTRTAPITYRRKRTRSVAVRSGTAAALQEDAETPAARTAPTSPGRAPDSSTTHKVTGPVAAGDHPRSPAQAADIPPRPVTQKRPRTDLHAEMTEAKEATTCFLASVRLALQVPLASMPKRNTATMASPSKGASKAPRRSTRLASQPGYSTVRASKRGELLVMRKLGLYSADDLRQDDSLRQKELASIFTGPLDDHYFAALRDIIPAAQGLSNADILEAAVLASSAVAAC